MKQKLGSLRFIAIWQTPKGLPLLGFQRMFTITIFGITDYKPIPWRKRRTKQSLAHLRRNDHKPSSSQYHPSRNPERISAIPRSKPFQFNHQAISSGKKSETSSW